MLHSNINPLIREQIKPIIEDANGRLFHMSATFSHPAFPEFMYIVTRDIKQMIIEQDFIQNYGDHITLTMNLPIKAYMELYNIRKELRCSITMTSVDEKMTVTVGDAFFQKKYFVFFITQTDPFKTETSGALLEKDQVNTEERNATKIECKIELISCEFYEIRKRKSNFIAHNATMKQILEYTATVLGIKKISMIDPDNTTVYPQFIVPPVMGIKDVFGYLQKGAGNGIYNRGFCYYYTGEVLYIYPRFAVPVNKNIIHITTVGTQQYRGMTNYCSIIGNSLRIMAIDQITSRDFTDIGVENEQTAIMYQEQSGYIENLLTNLEHKRFDLHNSNLFTQHWTSDQGVRNDAVNIEYRRSRSNVFQINSDLVRVQGITLHIPWKYAIPWLISPNRAVYFHYEVAGVYKRMICSTEQVTYNITPVENNTFPIMQCNALIHLLHTKVK